MRIPLLTILFALTLVVTNAAAKGESPISISVAIPLSFGERAIDYRGQITHFHVIVSNISDKPQRIWQDWCSWGYYGLSFELTDAAGKKWVARKKERVWDKNFPESWTLDPHDSLVLDVYYADTNTWEGFPYPMQPKWTLTMKAVLEYKSDDSARQQDVWTGRVVSKAEKVTFYPN